MTLLACHTPCIALTWLWVSDSTSPPQTQALLDAGTRAELAPGLSSETLLALEQAEEILAEPLGTTTTEALGIPLQVPEGAANGAAQADGGAAAAEEEAGQRQDGAQGQAGQEAAGQQQQEERSGKKAQPGPSGDDLAGDFEAVPLLPVLRSLPPAVLRELPCESV